ncbi:MAG: hypothetical protein LKM39_11205 [Chiayiivirga sp.]|nr:hypothetical protein [Chiayiivirga sp.]
MFNAHRVPVGRDQIQHIEMARDIAALAFQPPLRRLARSSSCCLKRRNRRKPWPPCPGLTGAR